MSRHLAYLVLTFCLSWSTGSTAATIFPTLTGRVVDDAHILSGATVQALDQDLANLESSTTDQVVVATVPSLQGLTIEDYGYQLGRQWQIGQKDKNNGALILVAPKEHEVRIEVGYGLEPVLTDATSSLIITNAILPRFRANDFDGGVRAGVQDVLMVLNGRDASEVVSANASGATQGEAPLKLYLGSLLFLFVFLVLAVRHPVLLALLMSTSSSRFGSSGLGGGFGGGGFSGGGGGFGGGGASGSW